MSVIAPTPVAPSPQTASLWRRFGAFVHELLFLLAYLFIVSLIFASVSGESMSSGRPQVLTGPIAALQQAYLFLSIGAYFIYFWIEGRRTLAFKTWHLRLLSADNRPVPRGLDRPGAWSRDVHADRNSRQRLVDFCVDD
jgi:uncharacterized RDD family membrane protein YckC